MEYKLGNSLRVKAKGETEKLICPKCKKESLIDAKNFQVVQIVEMPDAKTQCEL